MRNVECQTELMVLKCEHIEAEREEETSGVINTVRDFFLHNVNRFPITFQYSFVALNSANYCFVTHY